MATKAKMVESRSHLRPNVLRPQIRSVANQVQRFGTSSASKHAKSVSQMPKLDSAIPKLEPPAMLKPLVQPVSSPPVKQITSPTAKRQVTIPLVRPFSLMNLMPGYSAASPSAAVTSAGLALASAGSMQVEPSSISPSSQPITQGPSKFTKAFAQLPVVSSGTARKVVLAAVPGFFGLMGLGQLYEGKQTRGLGFLIAGIAASFLSSWYIILPARIDAFLFGGTLLPAYALSFLAPVLGTGALASRLSIDLLGVVMVLWALQLVDAMGTFSARHISTVVNSAGKQDVSVPTTGTNRAFGASPTLSNSTTESKA
jgi:hypothetical protein